MVRSSSRLYRHILGIHFSANNRQCQLLRVPVPYTLTTYNIEKLGPSPFGHWRMFVGRGPRGFFIPVYIGGSPRIGVTQVQYERGQTLRGLVWTLQSFCLRPQFFRSKIPEYNSPRLVLFSLKPCPSVYYAFVDWSSVYGGMPPYGPYHGCSSVVVVAIRCSGTLDFSREFILADW